MNCLFLLNLLSRRLLRYHIKDHRSIYEQSRSLSENYELFELYATPAGDIDDSIITNNQDAIKVIRTVAKITMNFFEDYPLSTILINPVDEKESVYIILLFNAISRKLNQSLKLLVFWKV